MIYFVSCVIFYHLLQSIHIQYNTIQLHVYRKITVKNMGVIVKNSIDLAILRSMKKGCRPDNEPHNWVSRSWGTGDGECTP